MIENEFEIVEVCGEEMEPIRLLDNSPYPGVLFQFGAIRAEELNDSCVIRFEFEVFQNPNQCNIDGADFREYIGEILHVLIMQTFAPE